jgi:hypothetical protein
MFDLKFLDFKEIYISQPAHFLYDDSFVEKLYTSIWASLKVRRTTDTN